MDEHEDAWPNQVADAAEADRAASAMAEAQRLGELEERAEDTWLNRVADEAEAEGADGSISLEEMAAVLRAREA